LSRIVTEKDTNLTSTPTGYPGGILIKSERELEMMRRAGKIVATTLATLREAVRPGLKTRELDIIATREIERMGGKPVFKGYQGYPATVCVSINNEIVHGIPGDRVIQEGDLVKMDLGASVEGYIGDSAITVGAGKVSPQAKKLMEVTRETLEEAIKVARAGAHLGDIGAVIESYASSRGYSVVREYVGHGVGRFLHEDPQVPNYGTPGTGPRLRRGMTIAIEPMVNAGDWRTRVLDDKWTVVTQDGSLSAHFEHTIAIGDDGAEVLTKL
jgi:methionyl aminopeptidase